MWYSCGLFSTRIYELEELNFVKIQKIADSGPLGGKANKIIVIYNIFLFSRYYSFNSGPLTFSSLRHFFYQFTREKCPMSNSLDQQQTLRCMLSNY